MSQTPDLFPLGKANLRKAPGGQALVLYVRANPDTALQCIFDNAVSNRPNALDNVIDAIGDDAVAKEKINEHLPLADQASILTAWGDMPSAISWIAAPEVIAASILMMCESHGQIEAAAHVAAAIIRGLAIQLCQRADWEQVLDAEIWNYTLRDLLIVAVATEVPAPEDDEPRPRDCWLLVGLDPDDAEERLPLLDDDLLTLVTNADLFKARRRLAEKREAAGLPKDKVGDGDDA